MRYVIVGNGVAGMEAALALRQRDGDAAITIVSDEHDHLFSRPALMYVFAGQLSLRDTEPYDRGLYQRMAFERVRGRVAALDAPARTLRLVDGRTLAYERLLLAVGSRPRPAPWPGAVDGGVHYFVTLRDLEGLDRAARPGMRAVVIGGGLIGVEVAEILLQRGLAVTFVVREDWYFPVALDRDEATLVAEHLRGHGCDVRLGVEAERILRDGTGRLRGVGTAPARGTSTGSASTPPELPCDLALCAIGVVPNTEFLQGSAVGLAPGGGIEVDDALCTNVLDVWAAGDCANVTWLDGSRRPEQLWYTARDQGRAAASSMLGDDTRYRRVSWYNSAKFFDLEYTTAGWVPAALNWDDTPLDPGPEVCRWFQRVPGRFESQRIILKGDRVVGFNMLGGRWRHEPLLEWIEQRRSLDFVLKHLAGAQFDEEFTPGFRVHGSATLT